MAAAAAASADSIQNNHHQSYFVTATSLNPAHNSLAFNQSSESSVSSGSYTSSLTANQAPPNDGNVDLATPTSATQMNNNPTQFMTSSAFKEQQPQQLLVAGITSPTANELSVSSPSDHYGNFTGMQQQATNFQYVDDNVKPANGFAQSNGSLSLESQPGQHSIESNYVYAQSANNNDKSNTTLVRSSFQQHSPNNQRSSLNSLDSTASNSLMPINVKGMILNGVASDEVMRAWLISIKCDEYLKNFVDHGYDMHLLTRMTPQDLTAIGCKSPNLRKKLLLEIKKLNLDDDIPNYKPKDLAHWLGQLKLSQYYVQMCRENYDSVEKVCQLTWEDLEEIGIVKLGHQKRLLLGIEKLQKLVKQNEDRDHAIYDVHPNHRISLHPGMSDKRLSRSIVRSGFFTTKSGNLDNRGVPVATVMPALKHVTNSMANLDLSQQTITSVECLNGNQKIYSIDGDRMTSQRRSPQTTASSQSQPCREQIMTMSEFPTSTMKRPPPLPPVRTNSLKINPDQINQSDDGAYEATYGSHSSNHVITSTGYGISTASSTSFLRTPKLGTLTSTTNKMLSHGGHIQTINTQVPVMKPMPIREAPSPPQALPPLPTNPPRLQVQMSLPKRVLEEACAIDSLVDSSLVGHQIASADEFPPPPPPQ